MEGKINTVRFCKVVSVEDDTDADRIKVRLSPEDNTKTIDEIDKRITEYLTFLL